MTGSNTYVNEKTPSDGGPAFPFAAGDLVCTGISMRDYFAAAALQGMLADTHSRGSIFDYAAVAYEYAGAMLAARAQGGAK